MIGTLKAAVATNTTPFRAELDARHLTPVGDLYETELSLYSGSLTETVYTEVSILISRS